MTIDEMLSDKLEHERAIEELSMIRFCEKFLLVYGNSFIGAPNHDFRYFIFCSRALKSSGLVYYPKTSLMIKDYK